MNKLFTTESVSKGHPDKIADTISDLVLSECLKKDEFSKVACETLVTTNTIILAGEIKTKSYFNRPEINNKIKNLIKDIGYNYNDSGFEPNKVNIFNYLHEQSNDINIGVETGGAGDQGMMFGYATNETGYFLPKQLCYTHELLKELDKNKSSFLRPDAKSQITFEYKDGKPIHIDTILISQQNDGSISNDDLKNFIKKDIIDKILCDEKLYDGKTKILINPTGRFVIGGPNGDTGLTGRKIIVDTYGGFGYHGGGAFSGKDPSKVDRSGAYMARWLAKNIINKGYTDVCNVQLAYAIGVKEPVSIMVTDKNNKVVENAIKYCKTIDLTPNGIIDKFDLRNLDYTKYCNYSHFYNKAPWEII